MVEENFALVMVVVALFAVVVLSALAVDAHRLEKELDGECNEENKT
jgi:hypothetical protein